MRETIEIQTPGGLSAIHVGARLEDLGGMVPPGRLVIVSDETVTGLYGERFPPAEVIRVGNGEGIKTLDTLGEIYAALVAMEADRSTFIAGVGGGIVCDIAGFAASTYLRGVRFGFVATTLLAQVDASVGGKNGVNFGGYKNMVGVFAQPEFVICDPRVLRTLPTAEIHCGLAEIVKHAAIADRALFSYLEGNGDRLLALEPSAVARVVGDSVRIKAAVVGRDEREAGERRKLNFGHTFGHAIEKTTGVSHGAAVAAGMTLAARLSVARGLLSGEDARRLERLQEALGLPTAIPADRLSVLDALRRDKKRTGDSVHFVLLEAIGRAVVEEIPLRELEALV